MFNPSEFTGHDRTRRPDAKRCSMTRRAARREKSARLFLAFAFPAELDCFAPIPLTQARSQAHARAL